MAKFRNRPTPEWLWLSKCLWDGVRPMVGELDKCPICGKQALEHAIRPIERFPCCHAIIERIAAKHVEQTYEAVSD